VADFSLQWHPCEEDERITVVALRGSIDIASVESLVKTFERLVEDGKCFVIVDMEGVDFVSSPAVGALMGCRRRLIEKKGNLVLVGLTNSLKEKLNLMGANRIFRYYNDVKTVLSDYRWEHDNLSQRLALQLPANASYVPAIRRLVSSVVLQKGYNRKDAFRIETIIDELANNAIEHGDSSQKRFFVEFNIDREKVEVTVRNLTSIQDPVQVERVKQKFENPVVDDESIRGRGLALVKMLSSELRLELDDGGTSVHVTKVRED
jgi:anti-anti-sigma factor